MLTTSESPLQLEDAAGAAGAPAEASQGAAKRPAAPIMQLLRVSGACSLLRRCGHSRALLH